VSNGRPLDDTTEPDGRRRIRFADTMPMSTYVVAFIVGPLEATEPVDVGGVPLRVVHTPGRGHLAQFALDAGAFALTYFTDYYGIPYPADKLDLVAIPDFAFGAMENVGCVTFRETLLLVDPDAVTQPELQRVTDVINHEIAHMWFGNLVTMRWWNGIWLNEAFATFMEMKCTDAFRPAWQRWTDFGLSRSAAMDVDSLASTRPIEYEVRSPSDAEGMFDLLTYEKGAAVVRMLELYLGEDRFRDGIRRYLAEHAYGNTETHDLWDALEAATGEPVRRLMDSWIFQGGHPVVELTRHTDDASAVTLAQQRFRYLDDGADAGPTWVVPLRIRSGSGESRVLLDPRAELVMAPPVETLNVGGSGFYRVRLDDARLTEISHEGPGGLAPIERYGVVDDTWALVLSSALTAAQFLDLVNGLRHDDDLSVWQRMLGALDSIGRAVTPACQAKFRKWLLEVIEPMRDHLGGMRAEGEPERVSQLRATLFGAAGAMGHEPEAINRARMLLSDEHADPALAAAAIDVVAAHGSAGDHARFVAQMLESTSPQEAERYRGALADFPGADELAATLALTLDGTIRAQDIPFVIRRALRNQLQGAVAWAFVRDRWDDIAAAIPSNLIARMLEGVPALAEPDLASEIESFLDAHPVPQGKTTIAQHRERMRVQVEFRRRERPRLEWRFG
jgi:puromycin-sensitive aminopeptidase